MPVITSHIEDIIFPNLVFGHNLVTLNNYFYGYTFINQGLYLKDVCEYRYVFYFLGSNN